MLTIDLMLMRLAVDRVRLPGEPEWRGYLNRRTGEIVFVYDTEEDARWLGSKPPAYRTRAEINSSSDPWVKIPFHTILDVPDLAASSDPRATIAAMGDPTSVIAALCGTDSENGEYEELPTILRSLADPTGLDRKVCDAIRRKADKFVKEFILRQGIEAELVDDASDVEGPDPRAVQKDPPTAEGTP
jgi:hypothetical protein